MARAVERRQILRAGGAAASLALLGGCADGPALRSRAPLLAPVRATPDRLTRITVCTRPFRAEGPRLDVERIADKIVVHNYGHGGSGWSLSWGSGAIAVRNVLATGERTVAVIGCGALGLTAAILLQRAGLAVTIYAKDRPPDVRSALATGLFTPDSRICLEDRATPAFKETWQSMCRGSFEAYQNYLGLPGAPVEWIDFYHLSDPEPATGPGATEPAVRFAGLEHALTPELAPAPVALYPAENPFPAHRARRSAIMMFNLTAYARLLVEEFQANGGHIETREFHSPADFAALPQRTLVNATGYGARALFGDESVVPIRGQLARLAPQPEVNYGLVYGDALMAPRRDGLVVQAQEGEDAGYNDASTDADPAEAARAMATIASLFPHGQIA